MKLYYFETPNARKPLAITKYLGLPVEKELQLPLEGCNETDRWHATLMELPAWRQPFPG